LYSIVLPYLVLNGTASVVVNSLLECPHVPEKMTWRSNGIPRKNSYEIMWVLTGAVGRVCSTGTGDKKGVL
jgi:hypothetical protein